ncbi:MAG: hypothetical protein RL682_1627 [Pseudomonadota bacterium]|jgi:hypothetical protein
MQIIQGCVEDYKKLQLYLGFALSTVHNFHNWGLGKNYKSLANVKFIKLIGVSRVHLGVCPHNLPYKQNNLRY